MSKRRCIVVEDEQPAIELISSYIEELPNWTLVKVCRNAIEAIEYLHNSKVDILFLDIEMPRVSGFELLVSLEQQPLTVITSAYPEYGVQAYDLDVFDYLLKPYSFARILKTYQRIESLSSPIESFDKPSSSTFISIKVKGHTRRLDVQEILYAEAQRSYVHIETNKNTFRSKMTISSLWAELPEDKFLRVHRSFLVAIDKIDSFSKNELLINERKIPIGRFYKQGVMDRMNQ